MYPPKLASTLLLTAMLTINFFWVIAPAASSDVVTPAKLQDSTQSCLELMDASIVQTKDMALFLNPKLLSMDAAVVGSTLIMALPTAFASLPAGATLLTVRSLGAPLYQEVKKDSQLKAKQIFLDALAYRQINAAREKGLKQYPALNELVIRVNGPVGTLLGRGYSADEVANLVIKATKESSFCHNSKNFRMVHFKDYVLENSNRASKPISPLGSPPQAHFRTLKSASYTRSQ